MFQNGDKVFYPYHGAGIIQNTEEKHVLGETRMYYIIRFPLTETTIMIPSDLKTAGLRLLSDQKEIKKALEILSHGEVENDEDWKIRYKKHQDLLKSGLTQENARVVKSLYQRNAMKELSSTEKKTYQTALSMIITEIALALNKELDTVKGEVNKILEEAHPE